MKIIRHVMASALALVSLAGAVWAQSAAADNGTDPTKLRRMVWGYYEHLDLRGGASRDTVKLMYETPISPKTSLRFAMPFAAFDAPGLDDSLGLGDISLRVTHLLSVTPDHGVVLQGEIFADTAERPELGYGSAAVKATVIYAKFLESGAIFAPALAHTETLSGGAGKVSETVADFYFVPKLANPANYMTIDPAIVANWEGEAYYGSLAVTMGRTLGPAMGGAMQAYVKPSIFVGGERPSDWAIEVGVRVLGF